MDVTGFGLTGDLLTDAFMQTINLAFKVLVIGFFLGLGYVLLIIWNKRANYDFTHVIFKEIGSGNTKPIFTKAARVEEGGDMPTGFLSRGFKKPLWTPKFENLDMLDDKTLFTYWRSPNNQYTCQLANKEDKDGNQKTNIGKILKIITKGKEKQLVITTPTGQVEAEVIKGEVKGDGGEKTEYYAVVGEGMAILWDAKEAASLKPVFRDDYRPVLVDLVKRNAERTSFTDKWKEWMPFMFGGIILAFVIINFMSTVKLYDVFENGVRVAVEVAIKDYYGGVPPITTIPPGPPG